MDSTTWKQEHHIRARTFAAQFAPALRKDAYQEYALALLESMEKGKGVKYARYQARLNALVPMRESMQTVRIPARAWQETPELSPAYVYLDATLPDGEQTQHETIAPPEPQPMRDLPWEVLEIACSERELKFMRGISDGLTAGQALTSVGCPTSGGYMMRQGIARAYWLLIEKGELRRNVIAERKGAWR